MPSNYDPAQILAAIERKRKFNKLDYYVPYAYQRRFHNAVGAGTDLPATIKALIAANQVGKTYSAAVEVAYHATGLYPEWWEGVRFTGPISIMVGSATNETARDICQKELLGDPTDDKEQGSGAIPRDCISSTFRKPGIPNAFDKVKIHHVSGGESEISFRAYEIGPKKHMGLRIDFGWLDEEPPEDIYSQYLRATLSTRGKLMLTFTPENGVTQVVYRFLNEENTGSALVQATWEDAAHFDDPEYRAQKEAEIPAHQRAMRAKGIPMMGSGVIFPVPDEDILCTPFAIPDFWLRICGMDFGTDHPFAACWFAIDPESQRAYMYDCYRKSRDIMSVQADVLKRHGAWIPVAWPHDVNQADRQSGRPFAQIFREDYGVNMLPHPFSNPPEGGKMKEGQGGQGVEVGLAEMLQSMETGSFKVFSTCNDWWEEKRLYHRKEGKVVPLRDDLMSASRYGYMMRRFAMHNIISSTRKRGAKRTGLRNW